MRIYREKLKQIDDKCQLRLNKDIFLEIFGDLEKKVLHFGKIYFNKMLEAIREIPNI